jgi:cobalt-precorrin 5A hydrolase
MAGGEAMIAAGIGARKCASADEMVAAVRAACLAAGVENVHLLAGLERTCPALAEAAEKLGARLDICDLARLRAESGRCLTRSPRSLAATGVPSVAEAAALAAAGPGSVLIQPRIALETVTVALAASKEPAP